jgi:hypothetical protein
MLVTVYHCMASMSQKTAILILTSVRATDVINIVTIYVCDCSGVWTGELDLLTTCIHYSELQFTDHSHTQTSVLSLLVFTSLFLATASNSEDSSAYHSQVLFSQPTVQNSCQLTTHLTGSQAGGHITPTSSFLFTGWLSTELSHSPTSYFTLLHSAELLTTPTLEFGWPCL